MFFKDDEENLADMAPMGRGAPAQQDDLAAPSPEMEKPADSTEADSQNAHVLKALLSGAGGIMQAQADVPSAFEYLYGKRMPRTNFQATGDRAAAAIQDPLERKAKVMEYLKQKRENADATEQDAYKSALKDENSTAAKAYKGSLVAAGLPLEYAKNSSAADLYRMGLKPGALLENKVKEMAEFENQKKLKALDIEGDLKKIHATKDATPATDGQINAAGFAKRMEQAENDFAQLEAGGYDRASMKSSAAAATMPEAAQSEELKRQNQAERNFVNSVLRRESGAAISKDEFANAEKQYFPRAGDTDAVKNQKKANRAQAFEMMKMGGGKAYGKMPTMTAPQSAATPTRDGALAELERRRQAKKMAGP